MKKSNTYLKKTVYALIFAVGVLLIWWIIALTVNDNDLVPNLDAVALDMFKIFYVEQFYAAYFLTLLRSAIGFVSSFAVGFLLALFATRNEVVKNLCSPLVSLVRIIPTMAIASLLWLIFSPSVASVIVCFTVVMPYVYTCSLTLLSTVGNEILEMAKAYEIPYKKVISGIYFPTLKNGFITLLGTAFSFALKITVSSEVVMGALKSLGGIINSAQNVYFSPSLVIAVTLWTVLTGLVVEIVLSALTAERRNVCK